MYRSTSTWSSNLMPKFRIATASPLFILALAISSFAQEGATPSSAANPPTVAIKNFGQMNERFFRGAQPKDDDVQRARRFRC